jgi:hypothetical protein
LMLWRCGPGIVCVGVAGLIIGFAVVSALTLFIRQPVPRRRTTLALMSLMATLAVGYAYYSTSAKALFRHYVARPIPDTVRIMEGQYQGGIDPAVYLHFQLGPGDLDAILRRRPYKDKPDIEGPMAGREYTPAWWHPQSLTNATVYYWSDGKDPEEQPTNAVWLWVNEARTEAYFAYWNF